MANPRHPSEAIRAAAIGAGSPWAVVPLMLDLSRMKSVRVGPRKISPGRCWFNEMGFCDSISFTVARATIPTDYWASG